MARQSKDAKIKELEQKLAQTNEYLELLLKRDAEQKQKADDAFANSPYRYQLEEKCEFYKKLSDLNQSLLENAKKTAYKKVDAVQRVYEDNRAIFKEHEIDYFIGITDIQHDDSEYDKLRNTIYELRGKIATKNANINFLNAEIGHLQDLLAQCKSQNPEQTEIQQLLDIIKQKDIEIEKLNTLIEESTKAIEQTSTLQSHNNELTIIEQNIERSRMQNPTKRTGRPPKVKEETITLILELRARGYSIRTIAEQLSISVGTVHRIIKTDKRNDE